MHLSCLLSKLLAADAAQLLFAARLPFQDVSFENLIALALFKSVAH